MAETAVLLDLSVIPNNLVKQPMVGTQGSGTLRAPKQQRPAVGLDPRQPGDGGIAGSWRSPPRELARVPVHVLGQLA